MSRSLAAFVAVALAAAGGCKGASTYPPVTTGTTGTGGGSSGTTSSAGGGGSTSTTSTGGGGSTGTTTTSSTTASTTTGTTGTGGAPGSVCSPSAAWGAPTAVPVTLPAGARLAAITPDELTLAWVQDGTGGVHVGVADRADTTTPFTAATLPTSTQGAALDRVALSSDGLRVGVLRADRRGFVSFTRPQRDAAFTEAGDGEFVSLNQLVQGLAGSVTLGDPVLSADDRHFVFSIFDSAEPVTIQISARVFPVQPWGPPVHLGGPDLEAQGALRRHPTGISSDNLALFYWDDVSGTQRVGFRADVVSTFTSPVDLGNRAGATPDTACDAITFLPSGAGAVQRAPRL